MFYTIFSCIALWCVINNGKAARSAVNPDILANFAKNLASVLSPAILGEVQTRNNRSSFQPALENVNLRDDSLNPHSILDNIIDKTSNVANNYKPRSSFYNRIYADSSERLEGSETNERLSESVQDDSYLRQEQPNFYKSLYDFPTNNNNYNTAPKSSINIDSSIGNIQESSTNLHSSYQGAGLAKAAFPYGPFLDKPYGGFHGFGPYGSYGHHHSYGDGSSEEASAEENARQESNRTNHRGYDSPYFGHHPYSPFPYGGYGNRDFYGPHHRNGNHSYGNGYDGHGAYHGGPDFYGPPGYGYNYGYGYNNRNNNGNNNNRQTEEPTDSDQNNSTKNGYSPPYGPPWVKPLLGTFHGFPHPFSLPYDHFHGAYKGGPVGGIGHAGYPIYADPYLAGFPFHHPYGPFFHGKKYLPPKGKGDSGESSETTEAPAELTENETPERLTALNDEEITQAPSSNRYKTAQKELKRLLANIENRKS
ncbi:hypothetical protein PUN28_020242 [Cardiocondyla obscurior]|uniref:Uncharacterized protein n=1 Tax=Cardiocondyla obscurior TaxID=286306 RepID=A0AAW2E5U4_9HYME